MAEMRTLFHKADDAAEWLPVELHAVDAAHALEVDPDHWKAEKPADVVEVIEQQPEPEPEPEPEIGTETEQ